MNNVQRRFDDTTGRWLISSLDREAVTPFSELAPGLWVSRDGDGLIAECLIAEDSADSIAADARDVVERELGWVPDSPVGAELVVPAPGDPLPATAIIHEPGIPYVDRSGNVLVPTEAGTVRVAHSDSVLMIDVPLHATHEWVRVSDASTGHVLALGRVQRFGDAFGANVTFALDGSDIHIALTDTPLDPVADRRTRRLRWLDEVLRDLRRQWWRHPWRTRDAARDAMNVARSLGDNDRERRARRFARVVPVAFACTLVVAVAGVASLASTFLPDGTKNLVVTGSTSAVYDFGGKGSLTVSAGTGPSGSVDLVMADMLVGQQRFEPGPGGTPDARTACRDSKNLIVTPAVTPAVVAKYVVSLRSVEGVTLLLGTVEMSSEASTFSSVDESCDSAVTAADGSIVADVLYQRNTEEFSLPRPTGSLVSSSSWTLSVERVAPGNVAIVGTSRSPVKFGVSG